MAKRQEAQWRFAPTGGGIRHGYNNAGAEHFRSAPEEKLIREIIQNALDAACPAAQGPVEVDIFPCEVDPKDLGAQGLKKHLLSCRQVMQEKGQSVGASAYAKSLKILRKSSVPALAILDRNTTGLTGSKWDSLIFEEGIPAKESEGVSGGSFGIGKNAPYNAAELHAVIYSTLYSNNREGRVAKMAGRAVLVSHPCSKDGTMLQNIGFLTDSDGEAVWGQDIPQPFRLRHTGTGLWILGFRPGTGWQANAIKATVDNFFPAIHHRKLVVHIRDAPDVEPVTIRHDTIEELFDTGTRKSDSLYFFRAIRQVAVGTTNPTGILGSLDVYVCQDEQAPNRVAYVNRRGMLITATKERRKSNPFHPARGASTGWSNYAAVIIAANDATDRQIRKMENPAHDEISVGRLPHGDPKKIKDAMYDAGNQITDILNRRLGSQEEIARSNLRELASLFPDFDPDVPGNRELVTRIIQPPSTSHSTRPLTTDEDPEANNTSLISDPAGEEIGFGGGGGTGGGGTGGGGTGGGGRQSSLRKSAPQTIQEMVIMRTGADELKLALSMKPGQNGKAYITLHPGGEEFRYANRIPIRSVRTSSAKVSEANNVLTVTPPANHQGHITIVLGIDPDIPASGYRFYERKDP